MCVWHGIVTYLSETCGLSELHNTVCGNDALHLIYIAVCYKVDKNVLFPQCGSALCEILAEWK